MSFKFDEQDFVLKSLSPSLSNRDASNLTKTQNIGTTSEKTKKQTACVKLFRFSYLSSVTNRNMELLKLTIFLLFIHLSLTSETSSKGERKSRRKGGKRREKSEKPSKAERRLKKVINSQVNTLVNNFVFLFSFGAPHLLVKLYSLFLWLLDQTNDDGFINT